jgi:hypothetical protein
MGGYQAAPAAKGESRGHQSSRNKKNLSVVINRTPKEANHTKTIQEIA